MAPSNGSTSPTGRKRFSVHGGRYIEFFYQAVNGRTGDLKKTRCLNLVIAAFGESAQDQTALKIANFLVERTARLSLGPGGKLGRQMFNTDFRTLANHDGALNHILQFPHVAGPAILFQGAQSRGGNALHRAVMALIESLQETMGQHRDVIAALA